MKAVWVWGLKFNPNSLLNSLNYAYNVSSRLWIQIGAIQGIIKYHAGRKSPNLTRNGFRRNKLDKNLRSIKKDSARAIYINNLFILMVR